MMKKATNLLTTLRKTCPDLDITAPEALGLVRCVYQILPIVLKPDCETKQFRSWGQ